MGLIKKFGSFILNFTIFFLIVTFSPGLPPKTTFPFEEFSVTKPGALLGPLEPNNLLANPEKLFEGLLPGPEHLLARDGIIYTALANGDVIKIVGDQFTTLGKFGRLCYSGHPQYVCGRPLGLEFDTITNQLIVVDSFYGIYTLNMNTGEKEHLVTEQDVIGVHAPRTGKFFNSVAVAHNGDLYFTHTSSEFGYNNLGLISLLNPSGRLIHYERSTGKLTVLLDNLWFANGVALSPDESFVIAAETHATRIQRFWLTGPKKGKSEMFFEGLPGIPDNITPDADGFWVALGLPADSQNPFLPQTRTDMPLFRKFYSRALHSISLMLETVAELCRNDYVRDLAYNMHNFAMLGFEQSPRSTIVRMNWVGDVVASYHAFDFTSYSHVLELGDYLYLGSIFHNYIARVKIADKEKIHPRK